MHGNNNDPLTGLKDTDNGTNNDQQGQHHSRIRIKLHWHSSCHLHTWILVTDGRKVRKGAAAQGVRP